MRFKGNKVWAAVDKEGHFVERNGKLLIRYQRDQEYEYWVHKASIRPIDPDSPNNGKAGKGRPVRKPSGNNVSKKGDPGYDEAKAPPPGTVIIYTDGASSGNPGPAGIGVLLRFETNEKEISKHIGLATNNIAELTAIKTGLLSVKRDLPIRLYTDSTYALGVLTKGWRAKKNQALVESTKAAMSKFTDVKLIKIKGHAGHEGNERADGLATDAIARISKGGDPSNA